MCRLLISLPILMFLYWMAIMSADGVVSIYNDAYDRDQAIAEALYEAFSQDLTES